MIRWATVSGVEAAAVEVLESDTLFQEVLEAKLETAAFEVLESETAAFEVLELETAVEVPESGT